LVPFSLFRDSARHRRRNGLRAIVRERREIEKPAHYRSTGLQTPATTSEMARYLSAVRDRERKHSCRTIVAGMLDAQEANATIDDEGVVWPSRTALYSVMALQSEINPRMIEIVRELSGAAMIMLPSSTKDFESAQTAADIERYFRSANTDARSRVALMRLVWDFIGSEFGSRLQQYEKFYGGASFLSKMNMYRAYDFKLADALVDDALNLPAL
jgi:hypothetical protein